MTSFSLSGQAILHKNYETASPSPSINVDWYYLSVNACKFALKTLFIILTLTEGGWEVTGARKKHVFCSKGKEVLKFWDLLCWSQYILWRIV